MLRSVSTVIGYALREGLRRRVFLAVLLLSVGFLALYGVGAHFAFRGRAGRRDNRRSTRHVRIP